MSSGFSIERTLIFSVAVLHCGKGNGAVGGWVWGWGWGGGGGGGARSVSVVTPLRDLTHRHIPVLASPLS